MQGFTIEDFQDNTKTAFELVVLASQRAYELSDGAPATVSREKHKDTTIALQELCAQKIDNNLLFKMARKRLLDNNPMSIQRNVIEKQKIKDNTETPSLEEIFLPDNEVK